MVRRRATIGPMDIRPVQHGIIFDLQQHAGGEARKGLVERRLEAEDAVPRLQVHQHGNRCALEFQRQQLQLARLGHRAKHVAKQRARAVLAAQRALFLPLPAGCLQCQEGVDPAVQILPPIAAQETQRAHILEPPFLTPQFLAFLAAHRLFEIGLTAKIGPQKGPLMTSHEIAAPPLFAAQRLQGLSAGTVQRQIVDMKEQPHAGRSVEHAKQRAPESPFMPRRDQRIAQKGVGMLPVLPVRQPPATVETLERERHEAEQRAAPGGARPQHEKSGPTLRIAMGERGRQKPAFAEDIRFAQTLLERLPA